MQIYYRMKYIVDRQVHNGPNLNAASVKQGYVIAHQRSMIKKI